ncbi:AAA-like domain-containing protein [Egbenema bharatensis]|uniref:AAA-like domain-containing protein n=1 Tax=Egbenema bharatensis TaxID=3463334 RepID=UPI003A853A27
MSNNISEHLIPFDIALKVADQGVLKKHGRHLKNIEIAILQGAWQGRTYDQIAEAQGYTPEYIKHDVGPKLWQLLSTSFEQKVSKSNLIAVITQQAAIDDRFQPLSDQPFQATTALHPQTSNASPSEIEECVGLVPLGSAFYVERPPVESRCYEEVHKTGALIRIKAPRQMGKTSLMVRILEQAKQQRDSDAPTVHTVALSLQRADKAIFADLDKFLRWFCAAITRKLQLSHRVDEFWSETFGSKGNCTAYFEDCILSEINSPLVIGLDQVDQVFLHPEIADDFFTLLRSWYEEAAYGESGNPLWQNLKLIIVHSTEVYIPLDINKSPFNVGLAIDLREFTLSQSQELSQRYGLKFTESELSQLMALIGGHPYLIQQAFYHLARQDLTLTELLQTAATDAGIYHKHLHRHLRHLQEHPVLAKAFDQVLQASEPVELEQLLAFKLHSLGLVTLHANQVMPGCELYRHYFSDRKINP